MRKWIDVVTEAVEMFPVRGMEVPVLMNPTRSVFRQFQSNNGILRACAFWDGDLWVFPANKATHGDIDESQEQYPLIIEGDTVTYRFDSSFPKDSIDEMKEELMGRLPHHRGLIKAMGSFNISFDEW